MSAAGAEGLHGGRSKLWTDSLSLRFVDRGLQQITVDVALQPSWGISRTPCPPNSLPPVTTGHRHQHAHNILATQLLVDLPAVAHILPEHPMAPCKCFLITFSHDFRVGHAFPLQLSQPVPSCLSTEPPSPVAEEVTCHLSLVKTLIFGRKGGGAAQGSDNDLKYSL